MKVLIACEFTQIVCKAFRERGHEAYSCDILPTEGNPDWHIKADIRDVLYDEIWDMLIAFPECTYLCNSGVRWLHTQKGRIYDMYKAGIFFRSLLHSPILKKCIENPIPHKYAVKQIGRKYDQIIQPWQFGHGETKATCLWLTNLPKLKPTNIVEGREQRIWKMSRTPDRGKERSRTFLGIAKAMAEQWG